MRVIPEAQLIGEGGVKVLLALGMGATSISEIADFSGVSERIVKAKINVFLEIGLVREEEGGIALSDEGKRVLERIVSSI
ncbi:MAG: hypothetical protein ACTSWP_05925 [Candidatus Freyarchaeota archaeon]|nr:hypothetical protein [Candidatus Freyrarchaeum guaymaensis]